MHQTSYVANAALHEPDVFARNARGEITDEQAQGIRYREQTLTVVSLAPLEGAPHNASGSPPKSA
jgi:hypothetical protein